MNKSSSHSPASEPNFSAAIDNEVSRCHLLDVSRLPPLPNIKGSQPERGRYVVLQKGAMPGDLYSRPLDFLLTKEGRWLPLFAFVQLAEQETYELCTFSSAAEAIQQLERLAGRAIVDEERIARARQADLSSNPPSKLDAPNGRSQSSTP